MAEERKSEINHPLDYELKTMESVSVPINETPESILKDLWATEKSIAGETLNVMKLKYERERNEWEKIFSRKEQELLALKNKLDDSQERLSSVRKELEEERHHQLEQIRLTAGEFENKKFSDRQKWEKISEEIKGFRDYAMAANQKYLDEQDRLRKSRQEFSRQISLHKVQIVQKEEEIAQLREKTAKKEEQLLKDKAYSDNEKNLLKDEIENLKKLLEEEKQAHGSSAERTNTRLSDTENTLKDALKKLELELEAKRELEKRLFELQHSMERMEEENRKLKQAHSEKEFELKKLINEEQIKHEKLRKESSQNAENTIKNLEEKLGRLSKSFEIVEQQFAQEQKIRKEAESLLGQKDQEIQRLLSQREELVTEWKGVIFDEQQNFKRRYSQLIDEYNKVRRNKEEEINKLQKDVLVMNAALSEDKHLLSLEMSENQKNLVKINSLEEDKKRFQGQIDEIQTYWQGVINTEREFAKKQMTEQEINLKEQLAARENEIKRLNEDLKIMNGQISELRYTLHNEKGENNARLARIQEFDVEKEQMKAKKEEDMRLLREEAEKTKKEYEAQLSMTGKREQELQEKNKALFAKIVELQQKIESGDEQAENSHGEKTRMLAQLQTERRESEARLLELQKKADALNTVIEKNAQDYSRKEQALKAEKEKELQIVREEMERLRNQTAKEQLLRQGAENKNQELEDKNSELKSSLDKIVDDMKNDKRSVQEVFTKKHQLQEEQYQDKLEFEAKDKERIRRDYEQQIKNLNQMVEKLHLEIESESKRSQILINESKDNQELKFEAEKLQALIRTNAADFADALNVMIDAMEKEFIKTNEELHKLKRETEKQPVKQGFVGRLLRQRSGSFDHERKILEEKSQFLSRCLDIAKKKKSSSFLNAKIK